METLNLAGLPRVQDERIMKFSLSRSYGRHLSSSVAMAGVAGFVGALLIVAAVDLGRYWTRGWEPSTRAVTREMTAFSVDPTWIKSGTPNFRATETVRSPDGRTISGLWACDGPTTFEWTFGLDETVHLLEGEVEVEYLGRRFTLKPGDTASFQSGTKATWHVSRYAKKAYTLHHPGSMAMFLRRAVAMTR